MARTWTDYAGDLADLGLSEPALATVSRILAEVHRLGVGVGRDIAWAAGEVDGASAPPGPDQQDGVLDELEAGARSMACSSADVTLVEALAEVDPVRARRLREDVDRARAEWFTAAQGVSEDISQVVLAQRRGEPDRAERAHGHEARVWSGWRGGDAA